MTATKQPAKPDEERADVVARISQRFLEDMLTVWSEPNEDGKQTETGINALRLVAATDPAAFIAAMGKLAEGLAVAKASKEG